MDNTRSALLGNPFIALILLLGLLFSAGQLDAQSAEKDWTVGIARFKGSELLAENARFTYAIPNDLRQPVRDCPFHFLNNEEITGSREQLKEQELLQLEKKLHNLLEQRATEFIEQDFSDAGAGKKIKELEQKIKTQRATIREIEAKPHSSWKVPTQRTLVLAEHNREGELFDPPKIPLKLWTKEQGLDCLILGRIEPLEDLLYIEVEAYLRATNVSRTIYRGSFFPYESESLLDDITKALRSFLYGKEWSDITMQLEPVTAEVYVDGTAAELDETGSIRYLDPGLHSVEIREPGYVTESMLIDSIPGSTEKVKVVLEKKNPHTWLIKSEPSGADIFLRSRQVGRTPLLLKEQVPPASLLISKAGYSEKLYVMEDDSSSLKVQLHPNEVDIDAVVENSRNRFYQGLAAFLFSLPLTVISYGQSSEYAYAFNSAATNPSVSISEKQRLHAQSTLWYTAYAGSMLLNGILLTDTFLHMRQYINSSQEY